MDNKVLILYPQTNKHLGLWDDLESDDRVVLRCSALRTLSKFKTICRGVYNRIYKYIKLPYHRLWYEYSDIYDISQRCSHIVLIDGTLNQVEISELEQCRKTNPNLKICLYLINSLHAKSPTLRGVLKKMKYFKWDAIYTFDKEDANVNGFIYAGFMYYSKHEVKFEKTNRVDVHFVGGMKGNRTSTIQNLYLFLVKNNVVCDFNLMYYFDKDFEILPGVCYFRRWRPYDEMLQKVANCNCIIEILQEGQNGSTLRYFEAVIYNKKLLTTNKSIVDFPFYNPRFMRIFTCVEDIDIEWLKSREPIDYHYNNEFSPRVFIDLITRQDDSKEI